VYVVIFSLSLSISFLQRKELIFFSLNLITLFFLFFKEREKFALRKHLPETVDELRKFNARRKLKVKPSPFFEHQSTLSCFSR